MPDGTLSVRITCFAWLAVIGGCTGPDDLAVSDSTDGRETNSRTFRAPEPMFEAPNASMAALTTEVGRLRLAVEELARRQTEVQALAAYLAAQQSRIGQVSERLDTVREELDSATVRSQDVEMRLAALSNELSRTTEREERGVLEGVIREIEAERSRLGLELQQTRSRESDLSRTLQLEETRWNELISRIEQMTQ